MNDSHETQLSATCLLLSVAEADEILEKQEECLKGGGGLFFSYSYDAT